VDDVPELPCLFRPIALPSTRQSGALRYQRPAEPRPFVNAAPAIAGKEMLLRSFADILCDKTEMANPVVGGIPVYLDYTQRIGAIRSKHSLRFAQRDRQDRRLRKISLAPRLKMRCRSDRLGMPGGSSSNRSPARWIEKNRTVSPG